MIKGVNKQIVEINCTRNDYIEKAILFINPQKSGLSKNELDRQAESYLVEVEAGGNFMSNHKNGNTVRKILYSSIIGAVLVSGLAVLFHFIYEWSGNNYFVGLFSAMNESVFEHTKILFFPYLIYTLVEFTIIRPEWKRFFAARGLMGIALPILTVGVFYIYTGIIGEHIAIVDILSAFVYVFIAFFVSYRIFKSPKKIERLAVWVIPLFAITAVTLVIFSISPPNLPLFIG